MDTFFGSLPLLQQPNAGGQMVTTFITFGLVIFIFYFLIIRPQNKKQKEAQRMLEALKKGDRVVTIGGVRGVVQVVKDQTVLIKVDDSTKIEFSKSAVSTILDSKAVGARAEKRVESEPEQIEETGAGEEK